MVQHSFIPNDGSITIRLDLSKTNKQKASQIYKDLLAENNTNENIMILS